MGEAALAAAPGRVRGGCHQAPPRTRVPATISPGSGVPATTTGGSRGVAFGPPALCSSATCSMVGMSDSVSGMSAGTHKVRTDDFFSPSETLLTCAVGRRGDHGGDRLSGCGVDFGEQCCVCVGGDLDP